MALFSIDIADEHVGTVLDAVAAVKGRPDDSTESKAAFANRVVREFLQEIVTAHAVSQAQAQVEAARAEALVTITDPAAGGE